MLSKILFNTHSSSLSPRLLYPLVSKAYSLTAQPSKSFKIEQIFTSCLSEFAYYIESNGEAAIIDPLRDIKQYLEISEKHNTKIKYVLETHFHADFVSGHIDLANKTGAQIVFGPNAETKFKFHLAKDSEELKLGNITIKVLHTPGHTLESSCYLVLDENKKPYCVFTGDTLFLGEVGRPDLAVKGFELTKEDLAGMLYDSLRTKLMPLPDETLVYPAHGAGSACGKTISAGNVDTLGNQKKKNYAMAPMSKNDFIKIISADLPTPPKYFFHDVAINKAGSLSLDEIIQKSKKPLKYVEFQHKINEGVSVLDCRDSQDFAAGYIPNSVNVSLKMPFAVWVASIIDLKGKIVLVAEPGKEEEAIIRLARVGYDNIEGYLHGGVNTWVEEGSKLQTVNIIKPIEFKQKLANNVSVIDVRNPDEWKLGIVKGAKLISLKDLSDKLVDLKKDVPYYLYCKSGARSQIAYSVMESHGFKALFSVQGGIDKIKMEGIELVNA